MKFTENKFCINSIDIIIFFISNRATATPTNHTLIRRIYEQIGEFFHDFPRACEKFWKLYPYTIHRVSTLNSKMANAQVKAKSMKENFFRSKQLKRAYKVPTEENEFYFGDPFCQLRTVEIATDFSKRFEWSREAAYMLPWATARGKRVESWRFRSLSFSTSRTKLESRSKQWQCIYLKMKITIIVDSCHFNARKMVEKLKGSRMMSHIYDDNDSTRDENWSA